MEQTPNSAIPISTPQAPARPGSSYTLLCVDDEANILGSLRRLFRPEGYRLLTAESGAAGLALLEAEPVDLVISDMRMPEMNGAQFLEQVRSRWPDTVRLLLTGYADIGSTIEAINKGQIYRYLSKPWDDNDMLITVRQALERKAMERENRRLTELTRQQNEELKVLNERLEQKVEERTAQLRLAMDKINQAHDKLKKNFINSVRVFSNLMEMRAGRLAGHSRRVADLARSIAQKMNMSETEAQDVFLAALLHDIGKLGLPDHLIGKPFTNLNSLEREEVIKHPARGQAALMALDQLAEASKYIRSHHERFDGQGYPDHLSGLAIPLGSRILAVANDFDALQIGSLTNRSLTKTEAMTLIQEGRGKRYDPRVVDVFLVVMGYEKPEEPKPLIRELSVRSTDLKPGMVLSRDLLTQDGVMLLAKDYMLDEGLIAQIQNFEEVDGIILKIPIKLGRK